MEEKKEQDWFPEAKIYHNGSHFIGIPHTTVRRKKRGKHKEEVFVVSDGDPVDKKASVLEPLSCFLQTAVRRPAWKVLDALPYLCRFLWL